MVVKIVELIGNGKFGRSLRFSQSMLCCRCVGLSWVVVYLQGYYQTIVDTILNDILPLCQMNLRRLKAVLLCLRNLHLFTFAPSVPVSALEL